MRKFLEVHQISRRFSVLFPYWGVRMATKIDTVSSRDGLTPRREPYWSKRSDGQFIGFRRMTPDSPGTWLARYRLKSGGQSTHSLGALDEFPAHERYSRAVALADKWFQHLSNGGATTVSTVMEACTAYAEHIREQKSDAPAEELLGRYRRWVASDPIADIELAKLDRQDVKAYRQRLVKAPKKSKQEEPEQRSRDTVNRDMAAVRAALNHALKDGIVTTDFAWREPLKAFKNVTKRRTLYLDIEQRRAFVKAAPADLALFLRCLSALPLRPGALAALLTRDFDPRIGELKVGKDKSGADRRIILPPQVANVLQEATKDKLPTAPLLTRADGKAWDKDSWKDPVKEAARAAGLPDAVTAYTLRHAAITDLVIGGLDLLTVAQISGTSVAMIEKHYGHLRADIAASALAKLVV
ncbi:tyrosine-type recombinase/integrase [Pseudoduganella sp. UC29_106]|uniref:tyrosine-type recombinase/integrase n=1 Tax=Pseudoduganella sp. UC29_106 TaxID=3374553 RepID=UPI0037578629